MEGTPNPSFLPEALPPVAEAPKSVEAPVADSTRQTVEAAADAVPVIPSLPKPTQPVSKPAEPTVQPFSGVITARDISNPDGDLTNLEEAFALKFNSQPKE